MNVKKFFEAYGVAMAENSYECCDLCALSHNNCGNSAIRCEDFKRCPLPIFFYFKKKEM